MKRIGLKCAFVIGAVAVCLRVGLALAADKAPAQSPQLDQLYVRLLGTSA
jgi:hypothetical protein